MNYKLIKLLLLVVIFLLTGATCMAQQKLKTIVIKSSVDSSIIAFPSFYLFKIGHEVIDTFGNIEGEFSFYENDSLKFIVVRSAVCFSKLVDLELNSSNSIYLVEDSISIDSGGLKSSNISYEINDSIEKMISDWSLNFRK